MWKIVTIRRNWHTTEEILVWVRNREAILDLLPVLKTSSANMHDFN